MNPLLAIIVISFLLALLIAAIEYFTRKDDSFTILLKYFIPSYEIGDIIKFGKYRSGMITKVKKEDRGYVTFTIKPIK